MTKHVFRIINGDIWHLGTEETQPYGERFDMVRESHIIHETDDPNAIIRAFRKEYSEAMQLAVYKCERSARIAAFGSA